MRKIRVKAEQAGASDGDGPDEHTSSAVTHRILMLFRPGRVQAAGVYEYADDRGTGLWSGLAETFPPIDRPSAVSLRELSERMLFAEALEAVACPDEGVIAGDASVARCWAPASRRGRRRAAVHQRL
jgi:3-hydroxyacyl-CoA dehydrogenase / enoyl-CoA hydratase / 3-hydroxybutyryl-CoA epimerase